MCGCGIVGFFTPAGTPDLALLERMKAILMHCGPGGEDTFTDLLPQNVRHRPKHTFDVPIAAWLRDPLRPHLEEALSDGSPLWPVLRREPVRRMARAHWSGRRDYARTL